MKIANMLIPEAVIVDISARGKAEAIQQLVSAVAKAREIDAEAANKDIAARERSGSTFIPVGSHFVAIPHALTGACKQLAMAVGTSGAGVPWDSASMKERQRHHRLPGAAGGPRAVPAGNQPHRAALRDRGTGRPDVGGLHGRATGEVPANG